MHTGPVDHSSTIVVTVSGSTHEGTDEAENFQREDDSHLPQPHAEKVSPLYLTESHACCHLIVLTIS